jgi:hypothetical protein
MAILRIKNANGTWEEIPAIVGPRGPQGPQGDSYILTEADKAEIVKEVVNSAISILTGNVTPTADIGKDGDIYFLTE